MRSSTRSGGRVVLCSGKVAYDALARRDELGEPGRTVAVVRVEQLYPWPKTTIEGILKGYPHSEEVVWLQEEPENMGAWNFVHGRLHKMLRSSHLLRHVSRAESASPATGSAALHRLEQDDLLAGGGRQTLSRPDRPATGRAAPLQARPGGDPGQVRKSWARAIHISVDRRSDSRSTRSSSPWNMAPYCSKPMARLCRPNP